MNVTQLIELLQAYSDGNPLAGVMIEHRGGLIILNTVSNIRVEGQIVVVVQSDTPNEQHVCRASPDGVDDLEDCPECSPTHARIEP